MQSFYVRNVSEALFLGKQAILEHGVKVKTRNGDALEFPMPVTTCYTHSDERVLFYPERDANPFFHLMESLWMLAGRNDVEWIAQFNKRMATYSDDGTKLHGAYGFRWRNDAIGRDQIELALFRLRTYENDRRVVISMWDATRDLVKTNHGKDYPCNTQIFFWKRNNKLNMTVVNRSNDMIWGAYGANAVHMSVLLEYMASMLGVEIGNYYQFSNNLHAYTDTLEKIKDMPADYEPYLNLGHEHEQYFPEPIVTEPKTFDNELNIWMNELSSIGYFDNEWLHTTATMVRRAWNLWKKDGLPQAIETAELIGDLAWRKACVEWLQRRQKDEPHT